MNNSKYEIVGSSKEIGLIKQLIAQVSRSPVSVLVTGDSGTGKELVARNIHTEDCPNKPFIAVNCGAIPKDLIESELFGHEKGAFTGATNSKIGKIEQANGGTLFLDEIGDLQLDLQVKLLRVLQERTIDRLGSTRSIPVNIRVIAATNKDLEHEVKAGSFREDLFYRINVFPIHIPSLSARKADIMQLTEHFVNKLQLSGVISERQSINFTNDALAKFINYSWPGNIRELENLVTRLMLQFPQKIIEMSDLPNKLMQKNISFRRDVVEIDPGFNLKNYLMDIENDYIKKALKDSGGVVAKAANLLGLRRTTLIEKLKKFKNIEHEHID
jgi:sigma-54 specific flagellar transcriptional regulator A